MPGNTGRYSRVNVETDPESLSESQTVATFRPGMRVPWVVVTTLITALASVVGTYYATHATPIDCASSGSVNALERHVSELSQSVSALTTTVGHNADTAHNDLAMVALKLDLMSKQK